TVLAWVVSKNTIDPGSVTLEYSADGNSQTLPMQKLQNYSGLGSGSGLYSADISGLAEGTEVRFFVSGRDSREMRSSPYGAPESRHRFLVGESRTLGAENMMPADFALDQNYPNPFFTGDASSTTIRFAVPMPGANVRLQLHDALGRVIRTLVDGFQGPGLHTATVGDVHLATGVYFYTLSSGDRQIMRRMIILK
ncbi:MAG: T9SS type A sorting domain-containing protein, partial [Bacteroidota bacterium]